MASPAASGSALSRFLRGGGRIQPTDVQAAALWGVAAGTAAIYLIQMCVMCGTMHETCERCGITGGGNVLFQPFDWIRKTFFEKPDPEQK